MFLTILSQQTFHFDASLWSNKETFNLDGGKTGFDSQEAKLPSYWNTSFSKICLGMKIGQQIRFIVINKEANSLYSLIADGQYRKTSLGRDKWKSLIGSEASLQGKCNREGFNAKSNKQDEGKDKSKARIGFLGNMKTIAIRVTLESGLVLVDCMITTIHVATRLCIIQTTATSI